MEGSVAVVFVWAYAMLTAAMTVAKTVTQDELLRLIDQAAAERWTTLDLSGKGLSELPPEIGKLTQLETLMLGKVKEWNWVDDRLVPTLIGNELTDLPIELTQLKKLNKLDLSGNPLKEIPKCIFKIDYFKLTT